jgi:exopolysaccharide biosynthesis polyprenyl glycosylphosphotransferase
MIMAIYYLIAYCIVWRLHMEHGMADVLSQKAIVIICLLYCIALYTFLRLFEGLYIGRRRILDLIFGFFFSTLCANFLAEIACFAFSSLNLLWLTGFALLVTMIESVIGFCWIMFCHRIYEKFHFQRQAIFIYGSREDEGEYTRVNNTINKYFKISRSIHYSVGTEKIFQELKESVVVFLGDIPIQVRNVILKFCMSSKIECYSIPKISDIYIQNAEVLQLNDKLLLKYPKMEIQDEKKVAKRLLDIVGALVMLVCTSPVMLVIAILIKLEDGGEIFYLQDRVTQDGRPFLMCKFRSMHPNAEKDGARLARKNDDRVTRVGRVIRNLHFDELPQLINVLKGEMSLVGPRPERQEFIDEYSKKIPEFPERLKVKGGLTGYAQVYGRYNSEPEDKIKYDLYYIYNYSLWLDIKILILTIRILFQKENTEGVDEDQISAIKNKP